MAVRMFIGFAHLPQGFGVGMSGTGGANGGPNTGAGGSGFGLAYSGDGLSATVDINHYTNGNGNSGVLASGPIYIQNNALQIQLVGALANANATTTKVSLDLGKVTDGVSNLAYMGFKVIQGSQQANTTTILTICGVTINASELGLTLGTQAQIELAFNRATGNIDFYKDNVFKITKAATITQYAAGNSAIFGFVTSATNTALSLSLSDFYFIDDTQDNTPCTRLGNATVSPLVVTAVDAVNWTSSDGVGILNNLQQGYDTSSSTVAPYITSSWNRSPVVMTLNPLASIDQAAAVKAVKFSMTGARAAGSDAMFTTTLTQGSNTLVGNTLNFTSSGTFVFNQSLGVFNIAPDGGSWSIPKLTGLKISVTPTSAYGA